MFEVFAINVNARSIYVRSNDRVISLVVCEGPAEVRNNFRGLPRVMNLSAAEMLLERILDIESIQREIEFDAFMEILHEGD